MILDRSEVPQSLANLKILHLIKGILNVVVGGIVLAGALMMMRVSKQAFSTAIEGAEIFSYLVPIYAAIGLFALAVGIANIMAYKYLGKMTKHKFLFVLSIVNCFSGILGIALGVYTLVTITKPEVKDLFDYQS